MTKTLYLAKGELAVEAKGYWFSSGGDKATFGYYPHLKRTEGGKSYPVYPDTQIHGDLKMAVRWIARLDKTVDRTLISEVFGHAGRPDSSLLKLADLELADKETWEPKRFDIKTRCQINEDTRTNQEHMLADMEWAWLDGLNLKAGFTLGYFQDEKRLEKAKALIEQAAVLLSGFGASRSRGYGRGDIEVKWLPEETVDVPQSFPPAGAACYFYVLTPETPFRNKPINPGATQLIASQRSISPAQIKGWLARTYHALFEQWPDDRQMAQLQISTARPSHPYL